MIDWDKIGPANSPAPSTTPTTTAPVTPSPSGPDLSGFGASAIGQSASAQPQTSGTEGATQAQVDAMNPLERLGRGIDLVGSGKAWDMLGQTLFGRGNGSPLGGVPLLGDIVGGAGNVAHGVGSVAVKPFEIAGGVLSHIPTGGLGADQNFNAIGEFAKTNDPVLYQKWQAVNAAASGDILGGGNLRYDFVQEAAKYSQRQR